MKSIPVSQIRRMIPLHLLPQKDFKQLCKDLVVKEIEAGRCLFARGDQDSAWIYLLEGTVVLETDGIVMDQIEGGTEAARFPLAHQVPRKVSGRALTKLRYIRVDQQMLEPMEQDQEKTETIFEKEKTGRADDWMGRLFKLPIFQQLPASNLQRTLQRFEEVEVSSGTRIIEQGEEADCVYVLSAGRCMATRRPRPHAKEFKLGEIQPGDLFGEDALISGLTRAVSVTMETDGVVQRLSKEDFIELVVNPVLTKISLETAMREVEQGSLWLDVRDPDVYQARHFEGSLNLPFFSLRMQLGTLDRKRRYIALCERGNLSSAAAFLLLRYGFEASVLEGGLARVPEKCFQGGGELEQAQKRERQEAEEIVTYSEEDGAVQIEDLSPSSEPGSDQAGESPAVVQEVPQEPASASVPIGMDRLNQLEAENQELAARIRSLEARLREVGEERRVEGQLKSQLESANAEKKRLEEQAIALGGRVSELESVIGQYVEAAQYHAADEGDIVQSLRTELKMVREQAEADVEAMRRELAVAKEECERLQAELVKEKDERPPHGVGAFLPPELQPVDPQQLPLFGESGEGGDGKPQGGVVMQGVLWCLVGVLASFSLLGIGMQTETGKRWMLGWVQRGGGPDPQSFGKSSTPVAAVVTEMENQEDIFAEDPGDAVLEEAPVTGDMPEVSSEVGEREDLFAE